MNSRFKDLEKLIIVPGHAVYVGTEPSHTEQDEFWKGRFGYYNEGRLYAEHVSGGIFNSLDKGSLLLFSGGQTREEAGPRSEALGYWLVAKQREFFGHPEMADRVNLEEFARDSYENLDFSIKRFRQLTGTTPKKVLVCGFGFKEGRYKLHAKTIGVSDFEYVTVNEPPTYVLEGGSLAGEAKTIKLFKETPKGDYGELLEKRLKRDPFNRENPYSF